MPLRLRGWGIAPGDVCRTLRLIGSAIIAAHRCVARTRRAVATASSRGGGEAMTRSRNVSTSMSRRWTLAIWCDQNTLPVESESIRDAGR